MPTLDRRHFLKSSALALGAGLGHRLLASTWSQPAGANEAIRVGVIGINDKGAEHIKQLLTLPGVRVVALCDVDPRTLAREVEKLKAREITVFATTDARRLLERSDVDAVVIATSNHWHALLTIWACQAGKHVYVEKPVSRTVWEGRKMVEAAARYNRIVQAGTQYRSDTGWPEAIAWLQAGHLGALKYVHTICYKRRESIGRRLPWYPDWLDYDMFCGPTPMVPLERRRLDYDWHWDWRTGNGELGNNGPHVIDLARRLTGQGGLPERVMSFGGHVLVDDVATTPNTHLAVYDFGAGVPILFEGRGLPARPGVNYMDPFRKMSGPNGIAVICEGGFLSGYTGSAAYDTNGKQIRRFTGDGGEAHLANFLAAVRSQRTADLAAPILTGHESTRLCHLGNISHRVGRPATAAAARAALAEFPSALDALTDLQRHLSVHGLDLEQHALTLGPWLQIDAAQEGIAAVEGADQETVLERARFHLKETQRAPWVIPDVV
ncbi:Inositol 2-dehydrogenase [Lacunisphaera limnophila]|uniref:Inositol 2-dehydrogenase n=1 Tax=Lacunisphaera limnophila TaxID=1838286 RepID=A0A1D8AWN3_9BACT|nr:Gfo/Idh/MocA family oxidoreductase [Lacunisphaera limnophila]AOS45282.1 Inositol 2-dehydrogenase [Lacunisphaera limnophila]